MQIFGFNIAQNKQKQSFASAKDITFAYIMRERAHLLPQRIAQRIQGILSDTTSAQPTLRELHLDTYQPLLSCRTLEEAKKLYPEFSEIQDAVKFENSRSPNVQKIKEHIDLRDLTLRLLQDTWARLKNQEDIAQELGLKGRQGIDWIKKQIGFINKDTNYTTLLKASDEVLNSQIGAKTTAFNKKNPEQMYRRNRHAAQACKKKKYRKAQRQRMLEYDKQHPERRAKISDFVRAVWAKVPDVSEQERIFLRDECSPLTRQVCHKAKNGEKLTPEENRIRKAFYKEFWARHPECRERYKWAWAATKAERAEK